MFIPTLLEREILPNIPMAMSELKHDAIIITWIYRPFASRKGGVQQVCPIWDWTFKLLLRNLTYSSFAAPLTIGLKVFCDTEKIECYILYGLQRRICMEVRTQFLSACKNYRSNRAFNTTLHELGSYKTDVSSSLNARTEPNVH
jgi:hypothetical protein